MLAFMSELKNAFLALVLKLLPLSPFSEFIDELEQLEYLGYINWFFPIGRFITIATAWLACITLYYMCSILLRWLKAID